MNVIPPDYGAVHQVNLEYLSRVVQLRDGFIYPDSVVGTDSHTTMINGLGILGWGKTFDLTLKVASDLFKDIFKLIQPSVRHHCVIQKQLKANKSAVISFSCVL